MDLVDRARAIAHDRDAGAAELVSRLLPVLDDAIAAGGETPGEIAGIVLRAQPAMAPLWHACAAALAEGDQPGVFSRLRAEMERAPRTLARAASLALGDLLTDTAEPLLLTLSYSSGVAEMLRELATGRYLRVIVGEGRPRCEGRRLAAELLQAGIEATVVTDGAVTSFLTDAHAVVLGADAVAPVTWINKTGSFGLAAAAAYCGTPVYVVASRYKLMPSALDQRVTPPAGPEREVWAEAPAGIQLDNPYFERVPTPLVTLFLMEGGRVSPEELAGLMQGLDFRRLIQYMSAHNS